jgi:Abnormal spindle-like microcephaly-assoc'd, ASPM-SPD-2-Hydin
VAAIAPARSGFAGYGFLCLLAATLVFSSYGCVGATGNGSSNLPSGLTLTPSAMSFGSINVGASTSQSVTVSNTGVASVSVGSVGISGAGFGASSLPTGLTLAPGKAATMTVTFAPSSAGAATGKLTVSDQSSSSPLTVALSGTGAATSTHSVKLTWSASPSSVAGYRVYRSATSGGPYSSLNTSVNPQLQWTDSTVQSGTTYYYVVTAVAANSVESAYSSQSTAAVPKP